eukprot:2055913-Pleurochrysis_carterae.AAC.2
MTSRITQTPRTSRTSQKCPQYSETRRFDRALQAGSCGPGGERGAAPLRRSRPRFSAGRAAA